MAVRKPCRSKGCTTSPRCEHPWWLDVMHNGRRYRMPVRRLRVSREAQRQRSPRNRRPRRSGNRSSSRRSPRAKIRACFLNARTARSRPTTVADLLDLYRTAVRRRRAAQESRQDAEPTPRSDRRTRRAAGESARTSRSDRGLQSAVRESRGRDNESLPCAAASHCNWAIGRDLLSADAVPPARRPNPGKERTATRKACHRSGRAAAARRLQASE